MKLAVLGSTGSIGVQALQVAEEKGCTVTALTALANDKLLESQCRRFGAGVCWIGEDKYASLKTALADTNTRVTTGRAALIELAAQADCDVLLNSLLGISGLEPTLAAIDGRRRIALANKETLVAGGDLVMRKVAETKTELIPVDGEHSAIFQCLYGQQPPKSVILTASGGAFYGYTREMLQSVTAADALKHPNWKMGNKITVDCATMMNKGFEIIEAVHLFGLPEDRVEVIIHRESIIHSMVRFADGSVLAHIASPDMKLMIQLALTWPLRSECNIRPLDLAKVGKLTFAEPDTSVFGMLTLARECIKVGGTLPACLNGADEQAVAMFLRGQIAFPEIERRVRAACDCCRVIQNPSLSDILAADAAGREAVLSL